LGQTDVHVQILGTVTDDVASKGYEKTLQLLCRCGAESKRSPFQRYFHSKKHKMTQKNFLPVERDEAVQVFTRPVKDFVIE